jgi:hypothetical protein
VFGSASIDSDGSHAAQAFAKIDSVEHHYQDIEFEQVAT